MNYWSHVWALKPIWVTILAFLVPLWIPYLDFPDREKELKCGYGIVIMAILWVTEAIPIPVTALMPVFLFPLLGVAEPKNMSSAYITDTSMLFFGGLIVAVALEESGLHKRISLLVMRIVGAKPSWLMLGLMGTTWFLSMWISNTAATSMMIPIISAVLETVKFVNQNSVEDGEDNKGYELDDNPTNGIPDTEEVKLPQSAKKYELKRSTSQWSDAEISRLSKAFALCVAYGANVGGIATLTGTPPNLVLKDNADKLIRGLTGEESDISFAKWMGYAFPMSLVTLILAWIWLQILFLRGGCFKRMDSRAKKAINATVLKQYKALGSIRFVEIEVMVVFIILVLLWLFRAPPNIDGWGQLFQEGKIKYASDSTPSILLSVVLFILPAEKPKVFCWSDPSGVPSYKPVITWTAVSTKLPWGVILLLGGGFALARASSSSGLSKWVGEALEVFADLDEWVMNLLICIIVASMTELTSNTATATLLMPIMSALGLQTGIHPLYLMISSAIACSFAFMLPVATPPNAIVFSTGYLSVVDMVIAGFPMNIIAVLCLTLSINTWGKSMFGLGDFPDYFNPTTTTVLTTAVANVTCIPSSGLSKWVGEALEVFADLDEWVMNLLICIIVASMTELTSNTATATLLMPIMSALVIAGFPMNIIAVLCLTLSINTWGKSMFGLGDFPDYFNPTTTTVLTTAVANVTCIPVTTTAP